MGGVWCKVDKGQARSYGSKGTFNSTISRWTDNVRHAYRKPKTHHRPPRPPQKPIRSNERLTISHPQLVKEQSSDGWRSVTLVVPETITYVTADAAPVPPPRKKRRRHLDLARTSYSMDDLNRSEALSDSTISLPDKYHSESCLESRSSSSTLVVTPVLETRFDHSTGVKKEEKINNDDKENIVTKIEEEDEDERDSEVDFSDVIVPIEKETFLSSRIVLHPTGLGFIDKLSAISEVSTESGFDDRTEVGRFSDRSGSVTSYESISRETGLNILAHIQNINNVSNNNEADTDIREMTAISKKEWLQNILKEDTEPYFIAKEMFGKGTDENILGVKNEDIVRPASFAEDCSVMKSEKTTAQTDYLANITPPPTPEARLSIPDTNHSVLLDFLHKHSESSLNPFVSKEESIFLTNTKTNIIYKSLSSDKLTDDYDINYSVADETQPDRGFDKSPEDVLKLSPNSERISASDSNPFNNLSSETDYSIQAPKLVEADPGLNSFSEDKRSNVVSSFDFKEMMKSKNYVTALKDLQLCGGNTSNSSVVSDGGEPLCNGVITSDSSASTDNCNAQESVPRKESAPPSRRSSLTDSLHEFEMSIYDMLKESKKNRDSSDEDESLKTIMTKTKQ